MRKAMQGGFCVICLRFCIILRKVVKFCILRFLTVKKKCFSIQEARRRQPISKGGRT